MLQVMRIQEKYYGYCLEEDEFSGFLGLLLVQGVLHAKNGPMHGCPMVPRLGHDIFHSRMAKNHLHTTTCCWMTSPLNQQEDRKTTFVW